MENDAESTLGVGPGDGTLFVADHVAGSAFEAVLVIEQDSAVTGWDKEVGRAGHDTFPR